MKPLMLPLLSVFVLIDTLAVVSATCLSGWVDGYESCYKFVSTPATWRVAQGTCRDMGGYLAVLDSARKNAFVTGYMLTHGLKAIPQWWIGGSKIDGRWQWSSRDFGVFATTYSNWKPGQPDSGKGVVECMQLRANYDFKWDEWICTHKFAFICEKEMDDVVFG